VSLVSEGWSVRGTTRDPGKAAGIERHGIEAAVADPERPGTVLDMVGDVTVIHWLLGSALGETEAIHGASLEALLARLVDTPVRGFVYEAAGSVPPEHLERGREIVSEAARRWRIPAELVEADAADPDEWLESMASATRRLVSRL
jgi:uncharacterized protein YbjT (DUF2867 family)